MVVVACRGGGSEEKRSGVEVEVVLMSGRCDWLAKLHLLDFLSYHDCFSRLFNFEDTVLLLFDEARISRIQPLLF